MYIKGTFTSVWGSAGLIETDCELNKTTGELFTESVEVDTDNDFLEREYFTDSDGNEYEVCPNCHCFVLEIQMIEGAGKQLTEVEICQNCDC
jgi:hypothetical protein